MGGVRCVQGGKGRQVEKGEKEKGVNEANEKELGRGWCKKYEEKEISGEEWINTRKGRGWGDQLSKVRMKKAIG